MAAPAERTIADVLNDIIGNVQQIVRAEMRLAKVEIREEVIKLRSAAALFACGAVAGLYCIAFLLLAMVYALAAVIAPWTAALIVGVGTALVAAICIVAAGKALKHVGVSRTIDTIREDIQWAKTQTK